MNNESVNRLASDVFGRLERSRVGQRMQVALTVLATGESYRNSAHAVGYRDHRDLRRHAKRLGFDRLHREQRRRLELDRLRAAFERVEARMAAGKRLGRKAYRTAIDLYAALRDER